MTKERLQYLLKRYLDDTATEEERMEYDRWYEQTAKEGKDLFGDPEAGEAEDYKQRLFSTITQHIGQAESKERKGRLHIMFTRFATAACVILLVATGVFYFTDKKQERATAGLTEEKISGPKDDTVIIRNYTMNSRQLTLDDGTGVELSANSVLSYSRLYGNKDRRVYLKGKGTFNVTKDLSKPFIVLSEGIVTTVLGTSFTVTAYPGKDDVLVALHTGRVVIRQAARLPGNRMNDIYLLPGQRFNYHISSGMATVERDNTGLADRKPAAAAGARKGYSTEFRQTSLADVLKELEKGYSVRLQWNENELANMIFSGRIRETDTLLQVLQRIAILHDLKITENGKGYRIQKKR